MANNIRTILIYTVSGSNLQAVTTGSYDLRVSPYSSTGISGTHLGGGAWLFTGLSDIADYKLYNTGAGTEVTGFSGGGTNTRVFFDGDLQNYIRHNGTIAFTANQAMGGFILTGLGAGSANGHSVRYEQAGILARDNTWTAENTFQDRIPQNGSGRSYGASNLELVDVQYLETNYGTGGGSPFKINVNKLFVDADATQVTGKIYTTIQGAITYASTQTPSSTSRWTIIIMPHKSAGYAEDITLVRFVDLIGWGDVCITGGLTTTQITTAQTWTNRDARIENLVFNSTDKSYFFRLLHIKNCIAKANGAGGEVSFYIDGCNMKSFGIYTQNDVDLQANNTEQENRGIAYGNEEPVWETSDDTSFTLLNTLWEF